MRKDYISQELALELMHLGFDEICYDYYTGKSFEAEKHTGGVSNKTVRYWYENGSNELDENCCTKVTRSQALRFFNENYGLYTSISPEFYRDGINICWQILWYLPKEQQTEHKIEGGTMLYGDNNEYPTQEDAELGCIEKMIELVKVDKIKKHYKETKIKTQGHL